MNAAPRWRVLVADPRSVRAIDETLLDCREELSSARGRFARLVVMLRAMAALARVGVRVSLFEISAMAPWTWALRLFLWTAVPVVFFAVDPMMRLQARPDASGWLILLLVPQALVAVLPFSLLCTTMWPPRGSRSAVVLPCLAALILATTAVVVTPQTNQVFRTTVFERNGGSGTLSRAYAEMSVAELARTGFLNDKPRYVRTVAPRARNQFFMLTGLIALAGAWAVVGTWLARSAGRRWPWAVGMPPTAVVIFAVTGAGLGFWIAALASLIAVRSWVRPEPSGGR